MPVTRIRKLGGREGLSEYSAVGGVVVKKTCLSLPMPIWCSPALAWDFFWTAAQLQDFFHGLFGGAVALQGVVVVRGR